MMRRLQRIARSWSGRLADKLGRRGGAAVELAFAFPVLMLLFGVVVDYGLMLRREAQLGAGVANAAQFASLSGAEVSSATLQSITQASSWLTGAAATASAATCHCPSGTPRVLGPAVVCTATCTGGATAARYISINGSYVYSPLFPGLDGMKPKTLTHSAAVMVR